VEETQNEEMVRYAEDGAYEWYSLMKVFPEKPLPENDVSTKMYPLREFSQVPHVLEDLYKEVVIARNQRMLFLAAAGLRMLVEAICNDQGITGGYVYNEHGEHELEENGEKKTAKNLVGKINGLAEKGVLTLKQTQILHQIRKLGNGTVHDIKLPRRNVVTLGIEVIEHIFMTIYDIETYTIVPTSSNPTS
jgi:hypothetical protein